MKKIVFIFCFSLLSFNGISQQATWIWYPGDYEIWLGNVMQNRRTERGVFYPPFWKTYSHDVLVEFTKQIDLKANETIEIFAEGRYYMKLDGKLLPADAANEMTRLTIPAGKHSLSVRVFNQQNVPAVFVRGETIFSDSSWRATCEDFANPDESQSSGKIFLPAGYWNFNEAENPPSKFKLTVEPHNAISAEKKTGGVLYDFGKETFGYVVLHNLTGNGRVNLYYGESPEEALDTEGCETFDILTAGDGAASGNYTSRDSRAFRYIFAKTDDFALDSISMLYEYLPLEYRGKFRCSDDFLNKIHDVAVYTLHLTTREFFIDGIKRDRWVWSGDACQSYLMNYYSFFDSPAVKRTILQLRGKEPVTSHINTIMDYSFYWFISIYDYYLYTGDRKFIELVYPRMKTLMDFCLSRRNKNGMLEGLPGDWVFIDWVDFEMSKDGEISFEQLLFYKSLETMATFSKILGYDDYSLKYKHLADDLYGKIISSFWNEEKKAFIHNRIDGVASSQITPFMNMFAVLFNAVDSAKRQEIKQNVLLNPEALKITTPYMRFYELESLCMLGEHKYVLDQVRDYWGGMLRLGATSFWEKYNPEESGAKHYAMYGRPYGKSLCHAWGASPLYLLGKYYLGVKPEKPGYKEFSIRPVLADLKWIEGTVPTPHGNIKVYMDKKQIKIEASEGEGYLYFSTKSKPRSNSGTIETVGKNEYKLKISSGNGYIINL
ncbi:MAG: alpha-rhamnosidase [Tannerella sp.]|jgi:hypothetical protein|nr:alpha-rhamnosidase [Tannerella sp.]